MTLLHSLILPLGTPLIDFSLPDPRGKIISSKDFYDRKVLVIIFMCNHCPYVQAVLDRLIGLQANYNPTEVQLVGINANNWTEYPEDSPQEMEKMIHAKGINFPYIYDESQEVAKKYQAQCTPDIFVFNQVRRLVYHGRIDDDWKDPLAVKKHELKNAIDAILNDEKLAELQHLCMGCSIKWRAGV